MGILNDYTEKARVYFELSHPKPVKARVILEDGSKEELILYDGLFIKGKNGYAPLFYVKDGVEIQVGAGDRIIGVPTGESAFWSIPPEFLGYAKKDISDIRVQIYDYDDVSFLSKVYNYLLKVAPDFRHKYERKFILSNFDTLNKYPDLKYAVINSVNVRETKVDDHSVSVIELNDGRTLVQTDRGLYLLFDETPTALAMKIAIPLAYATTDYAIVDVKTTSGDVPVNVHTYLGDVISLIKKMKDGVVVINKKSGEFIAKLSRTAYVSGDIRDKKGVEKLEKRLEFSHTSPVGDIRYYKNKWGNKVIVVFTTKNISSELIDSIEEYVEDIRYTTTWLKGMSEELRKAITVKLPTAVAGFIGKAIKRPERSPLDIDEL